MKTHQANDNSLVSCVMIFLNPCQDFFVEAIESVLSQTYDNLELILVNDGSSDESTGIARNYAQTHKGHVVYVEHENRRNLGKSAARNLGIKHAKGKYISFLDADDTYFSTQIEQQVKILESYTSAAMVWGRTQVWFSWSGKSEDSQRDIYSQLGTQPNKLIRSPALLTNLLDPYERAIPCTCSVLVRHEIFEELGGFEDDFKDKYEDTIFWIKVFANRHVFVADNCWGKYRQHATNSCLVAMNTGEWIPGDLSPAHYRYLTWVENYLRSQHFSDNSITRVLQGELWKYRNKRLFYLKKTTGKIISKFKKVVKDKMLSKLHFNNKSSYEDSTF